MIIYLIDLQSSDNTNPNRFFSAEEIAKENQVIKH